MSTIYDTDIYTNYYSDLVDFKVIDEYYKEYLNHILEHKKLVYIAWIYIVDTLCKYNFINESDINKIHVNILNHDNSKLLYDEFIPYAKRFNGHKKNNHIVKTKFKDAVKLHKERNLHHFEALKKYCGKDWKYYAIELICDYIAMGWEFNDFICEYFNKVKDNLKNELPKEYYKYIEDIISVISIELTLTEEPLSNNNIEYIYYLFNYYNDPFEKTLQNKN